MAGSYALRGLIPVTMQEDTATPTKGVQEFKGEAGARWGKESAFQNGITNPPPNDSGGGGDNKVYKEETREVWEVLSVPGGGDNVIATRTYPYGGSTESCFQYHAPDHINCYQTPHGNKTYEWMVEMENVDFGEENWPEIVGYSITGGNVTLFTKPRKVHRFLDITFDGE